MLGIAAWARQAPGKPALVAGDTTVTFGELDARAGRAAAAFARLGIASGDVVAVAVANRPEFFEAAAGAARLGAFVVPVPHRASEEEIAYLVSDSGARLLVAERTTMVGDVPALAVGSSYETARDPEEPLTAEGPAPVVFRYYTSGTTGHPKAVVRDGATQEAALRTAETLTQMWDVASPDDVHLVCGPLYHTAPCAYGNYALLRGQTVVILEHFVATDALEAIQRHRVTWSHMVPINFVRILREPRASEYDVSSLRRVIHAAAPCPVDVKRRIMGLFPPGVVWEYYGMTEGFATLISPEEWLRKPGSVGRAMPGVTLTIRDESGRELPPFETGVVYVTPTGGRRFQYGGDDSKTRQAWRGEQFTVGDMGYLDDDRYLFLTDRKQDLIISGGANVYPAEVEAVLYRHPGVADVSVIGIPDDEWGERVHAIVEGAVTPDELIAFCRDNLAHYKCPTSVEIVERLPRDDNGKVRKRELRERYWAGRSRRI